MNGFLQLRHLWLSLAVLVLGGCASGGGTIGEDEVTGQLGNERGKSPAALYVEMGVAYMKDGQSAVALKKLKKAISLDPKYAQAHNVIAILYERLGENKLAGEHYQRAVELQPQDPYIRNAHGSYFCKQGLYEKAEMEFERALSNPLYTTPWVALTNAGLCAERNGDKEKAENYYRRALTANDGYFQALIQMAELLFEKDNPLSARAYLERYNAVAEPTAGSLWLGVRVERKLGDRYRSREYRARLLKSFPDAPEVQLLHQSER